MQCNRRDFLKAGLSGLAYFTMSATVPAWISKSAKALAKSANDRILVIVQMAGGNDGLNTVIPYTDALYNGSGLRPNLHIVSGLAATTLDGLNALHPKLARLAEWYAGGKAAVVNNVGYPNPNLSHFVATDFWEYGASPGSHLTSFQGWASRVFDSQCAGTPPEDIAALGMLAAGAGAAPPMIGGSALYTPPSVQSFSSYTIDAPAGAAGDLRRTYIRELNAIIPAVDSMTDFVQRIAKTAQASVGDIATASAQPLINTYPAGSLGAGLDICSRVIRAGFPTKVFYVSQGGYDTHANQFANNDAANAGVQQSLLDEFDQAVHAFLSDMWQSGNIERVLLLTFSEFGRRVQENSSSGTDHGTANCLFVMGGGVNKGVYGGQPDLQNLQNGNLVAKVDFRSVYSRVIKYWLEADPEPIFGSADFNDPVFRIGAGMKDVPFVGMEAPPPAESNDIDGNGAVDAADIQLVINSALDGSGPYDTDVNHDGVTDAVDVQSVVNAALGR